MSQSDHEDYQRSFPSSIPVRSPSPDLKNKNRILKTISPTLQVRKQMTPILRDSRGYATLPNDENQDTPYQIHDFDKSYEATDIKRLRQKLQQKDRIILQLSAKSGNDIKGSRTNQDLKQKLSEKDKTINDLKKVVATLSEKSQISESRSENQKIRTLEIENERLGEIVRKLNKKDNIEKKEIQEKLYQEIELLESRVEELAIHNRQLEDKILRAKKDKDTEINGLKEQNQQLKNKIGQLLAFEQRNNILQNQNQRLLKLLTDKKSSLPEITIAQQNQIFRLQGEIKALKEKAAPEKMTLSKIREQYNQSLRLFKDQVEHLVQLQFEKMQEVISNLKNKLVFVESKIPQIDEIQRSVMQSPVKLAQLSKSYIEQTADLNSEIKRQRGEKRAVEEKLELLQKAYDSLIRTREDDLHKSQEKMRQSVVDIEQLKNQAQQDRKKHYQQLDIIKISHQNQIARLKNKHKQQIDDFKNSTKYEINEVVANYNKQISVLRVGLSTMENEIQKLQQDGLNKEVEYRRNIQIVQQRLRNETNQVTRLTSILNQKQGVMKSLRENKQEIEELGEVRRRSQTELQLRYNDIEIKYSELLGNHADTSTKYTQLLNKFNTTVQEYQKLKRVNSQNQETLRNLSLQNQMIPALKNQITNLQEQLLNTEHTNHKSQLTNEQLERNYRNIEEKYTNLQSKYTNLEERYSNIQQRYSNLEEKFMNQQQQLSNTIVEKNSISNQIAMMKYKLSNINSKTRVTFQSITKLETQTLNPSQQFFRLVDEIAERITRIEIENDNLKGIVSTNHIITDNIKKDLLRSQIDIKAARFEIEQLKNDINHLNQKLQLKENELSELRELLDDRVLHQSTIVEDEGKKQVNLDDVNRLKKEYEKVIQSLSTEIVAIKRSVIETTEREYQREE